MLSRVRTIVVWMWHPRQRRVVLKVIVAIPPATPVVDGPHGVIRPGWSSDRGDFWFTMTWPPSWASGNTANESARALRGLDEGDDEHILHYKSAGSPRMAPAREATLAYVHGGARPSRARQALRCF